MPEPVEWLPDGTPRNPRFDDIYRSRTGAAQQAHHVFLKGCGLPQAWADAPQWRVLETGFGLGTNFLAAWRAWKDDPQRPRLLHFFSIEAFPVAAADIVRSAEHDEALLPLAQELSAQWEGLMPGTHRLAFDGGRVMLTLVVSDVRDALASQAFAADSVFLDGFDPQRNPRMWDDEVLEGITRFCRTGTRVATWSVATALRDGLSRRGFAVERVDGLAPKRHALSAVLGHASASATHRIAIAPGRCVVIGAGLAGSAVASSLAMRGWQVVVLDAAEHPAAGASGLPAGLVAPHHSADDAVLSRLIRAGVRLALRAVRDRLVEGEEWARTGVMEHRPGKRRSVVGPTAEAAPWTRDASDEQLAAAGLPEAAAALWHSLAGWVKPASLVRAWLSQPGVRFAGGRNVQSIEPLGGKWRVSDRERTWTQEADLVVIAAACASASLSPLPLQLQAVRGQVMWGDASHVSPAPPFPVNGNGHFIPAVPIGGRLAWFAGSTYGRGDTGIEVRSQDEVEIMGRLRDLLPDVEAQLEAGAKRHASQAWAQLRCTSVDRRPLVGEIAPGLWLSTAMGSRGLTFALLCAELIAARLHDEPLPLDCALARAVDVGRVLPAPA